MKAWQWFLAHGDKLLVALAAAALTPQFAAILPTWAPLVLAGLAAGHTTLLPEPSNQSMILKPPPAVMLLAVLLFVPLLMLAGCKTTPTQQQQAGIAVAIDIATGLAVQQGSTDSAVWKARAGQFKAIAVTIKGVNDKGAGATLATLAADLQPLVAKLGPADVLAANALIAAITPYLQQQVSTNPTVGTTQAAIDIILTDVINACAAYGV